MKIIIWLSVQTERPQTSVLDFIWKNSNTSLNNERIKWLGKQIDYLSRCFTKLKCESLSRGYTLYARGWRLWVSQRTQTHLRCSFFAELCMGHDHVVATVGGPIILRRQNPGRYRFQSVAERQGKCQAVLDSISVWNMSMQLDKY